MEHKLEELDDLRAELNQLDNQIQERIRSLEVWVEKTCRGSCNLDEEFSIRKVNGRWRFMQGDRPVTDTSREERMRFFNIWGFKPKLVSGIVDATRISIKQHKTTLGKM